ncbi:hypothetical protein OG21DRAFT_1502197 [Imleria badia]|nr:hypothetical protein OG21DRAFT_1502197 [Imleria badia]
MTDFPYARAPTSTQALQCDPQLPPLLSTILPQQQHISPLYKKYELGTTVFSALASGLLTGKYNDGVPEGTRFAMHSNFFKGTVDSLQKEEGLTKIRKVRELSALAEVAKNPNTSTVILGASRPEQVLDNLKALEVIPKLTPEILDKIEAILDNKPAPPPTFGRPALDPLGRL